MRRWRRLAALILVTCLAAVALPACGSDSGDSTQSQNDPTPTPTATSTLTPTPTPTPTPSPEATAESLGCHQYCQQAGGYGGGEEGKVYMRVETSGTVVPISGALPIEVTCLLPNGCRGALLVYSPSPPFADVGRSDLDVEGKGTATIAVPISEAGLDALDSKGGRLRVEIIADYGNPECPPRSILPCTANGKAVIDAT